MSVICGWIFEEIRMELVPFKSWVGKLISKPKRKKKREKKRKKNY